MEGREACIPDAAAVLVPAIFVTCQDIGTQHVNQDRALVKGRRLLQGGLQGRMSTEHKSVEIQMKVWAQVSDPVSLSSSHLPCTFCAGH